MDQRALAGIGNVYKSELLWIERVSPFAPVDELDDGDARAAWSRRGDACSSPTRRRRADRSASPRPATAAPRDRSTSMAGPAGPAVAAVPRSRAASRAATCRGRRTGARPARVPRASIRRACASTTSPGPQSHSGSTSSGRSPSGSSGSGSPGSAGARPGSTGDGRLASYRDLRPSATTRDARASARPRRRPCWSTCAGRRSSRR